MTAATEEESVVAYKCLFPPGSANAGKSQYQKAPWPLPSNGEAGEWVEVQRPEEGGRAISICNWGLHGYPTLEIARRDGTGSGSTDIYEMEIVGETRTGSGKICGYKARLLRLVWDKNGEVLRFEDLVWQ